MTQVPDKPSIDEAMEHFGVMGMHWGVRRDPITGVRPIATALDKSKFGKAANANAERYMARQTAKANQSVKVKSNTTSRKNNWDIRKSKATAGVSRSSGVLIDRNARNKKLLIDAKSGAYAPHMVALGKKFLGEKQWENNFQTSIRDINAQNKRLRAGKSLGMDVLDKFGNVTPFNLVVSRTPKK